MLVQLRTHLSPAELESIYSDAYPQGLRYLAAYDADQCIGVAGWRIVRNTSAIRKLYVDDLVTDQNKRSGGVGKALIGELERRAIDAQCAVFDLDSGVQRGDAHRFYDREEMSVVSFHFAKRLDDPVSGSWALVRPETQSPNH